MNPFKFGTVVDSPYFINRKDELARIDSLIKSSNHVIIISPRRYGKTSLIRKVLKESGQQFIFLDMQLVVSPADFAAQLLKRVYRISPFNKLKGLIKSFRIIPTVTINPVSGEVDVFFRQHEGQMVTLVDVLNLIDKLATKSKRIVVALDEFQEIFRIDKKLDRDLRSIMQDHKNVNYIFSGSSESLIREIFEDKKSPFYHFAYLMPLKMITEKEFSKFLVKSFSKITEQSKSISSEILNETFAHPYYTQQLAFVAWEIINRSGDSVDITKQAVSEILQSHDNDYERLWYRFNRIDMQVLIGLSHSDLEPLSNSFLNRFGPGPDSTFYSSLQRLTKQGVVVKHNKKYLIDDPFFKKWIVLRRDM